MSYFKRAACCKGLNRRHEDPVNSALNYGYAIIRSYIIKALISTGFHCALGINHHNEYNSFNLADDLIEPGRARLLHFVSQAVGLSAIPLSLQPPHSVAVAAFGVATIPHAASFTSKHFVFLYICLLIFLEDCLNPS